MKFEINTLYRDIYDDELKLKIKELMYYFEDEVFKGNKVAFYYEDIESGTNISFNPNICFYAASSIKILVCLMMFRKALDKEISLEDKVLVTMDDLKQDTGIIKYQKEDTYYTIKDLIRLTIVESDNTAYLKLVGMVSKDKLREYGLSLGATHTMEGKETDSFGIINCNDMRIYWEEVRNFINENNEYSSLFEEYLLNPSEKLIKDNSINNLPFVRKYGSYEIAYHEAGYVKDDKPYYLIILTQLNKFDYKEEFINKASLMINEIHKMVKNIVKENDSHLKK